jgi:hypothetical protein
LAHERKAANGSGGGHVAALAERCSGRHHLSDGEYGEDDKKEDMRKKRDKKALLLGLIHNFTGTHHFRHKTALVL